MSLLPLMLSLIGDLELLHVMGVGGCDGREPGIEHPVVDDDRYLHGGKSIKHVVSAADAVSGRRRRLVAGWEAGVFTRGVIT
jgi:hypothetical protein